MNVIIEPYVALFERDLNKVIEEVSLYHKEEDLWKIQGSIANSGGNLILHIVGNLRHFIGHVVGGLDYERKRASEFNSKDIGREELIIGLQLASEEVQNVLKQLTEVQLQEKFPIKVLGYEMTTAYFIAHLYGHLNYHLGQLNYHRRQVN